MSQEENVKVLEPHQQRVVDEKIELEDKFKKLDQFILDNQIFQSLSEEDQELMKEQRAFMEGYLIVLEKRIARF
jgi:hypothetical protein